LAAIFTIALVHSPSLPSLIASVHEKVAKSHQVCHDTLTSPDLSNRVEFVPATAGLWANAKVILKEGETGQDIVAKAKETGVVIMGSPEFNMVERESGWIKFTFALPEDIVQEGMRRLKVSLL
jgi:DNA-binding transcriptional MocR family regulator